MKALMEINCFGVLYERPAISLDALEYVIWRLKRRFGGSVYTHTELQKERETRQSLKRRFV